MINIPRGTQDILPAETAKWRYVESKLHDIAASYNYKEIRTPMFESTDLFARGVGDSTDIVQKEMYTFKDKGDRSLTLRPEGTAAVVRSYIENKMNGDANQPVKLYYNGPMFRYERKQKGRYRQFVQFGVEAIGSENPAIDAEVIHMVYNIYKSFGLKHIKIVLNSIGDMDSREEYKQALIQHFEPHIDNFCNDCKNRLHTNPMRILDCKVDREQPAVKTAPKITDYLNDYSKNYYEEVKQYLDLLNIPYIEDASLVRGLDYYTHTAFEVMSEAEGFGAITTLCGGGRYNGLLEMLDGPKETGIGFALSIERLLLAIEAEGIDLDVEESVDIFVVTMPETVKQAVKIVAELRNAGIRADMDYLGRKMKGQMKQADRIHATYTVVLGSNEIETSEIQIKAMQSGESETIKLQDIASYIKGE
ncbi:histidine--tRNA ligase [Macrococcoides canis]|uniref:Histidine--tRNA ligase n=1 Tax=Macrococcoides canis TaxID=1855823 RepID=A0A4R6C7U5_9STAP|nr:histidine--tRNA ligase [Macrococcus canis]MEE1108332.1 histidine--tRNA ligase [Macrococcus canis]TDM18469.1 histidine--tRNA ligase [Macrococcus canis]TDM21484.1 histidine--tRNA ligase [Macrococcus canis]TDM23641.1 histidine--tRNA ligase [Macrococcus canis]TDM38418.1 histidine--tRNA ligase [Macrococcus canis]